MGFTRYSGLRFQASERASGQARFLTFQVTDFVAISGEICHKSPWEGPGGLKSGLSILIFHEESFGDDEKVGLEARSRDDPNYFFACFFAGWRVHERMSE